MSERKSSAIRYGDFLRHATVNYGAIRYGDLARLSPRAEASRLGVRPRHVLRILAPYIGVRASDQARAVIPLAAYLIAFQVLALHQSLPDLALIGMGLAAVILGLVFFLEGLKLGIMPFSETIGTELSNRLRLPGVLAIAFVIGVGATFSEPAIGLLKATGAAVDGTRAPLLKMLLTTHSWILVLAMAAGVGLATVVGLFRSSKRLPLKPFIIGLVVPLSGLTLWAWCEPTGQMAHLIALAWDSGGAATGPVTVPLVLALGIGLARASDREEDAFSGFGVVTLASLMPALMVLLAGAAWLHWAGAVPLDSTVDAGGGAMHPIFAAIITAVQAVVPLCLLLFAVLGGVLRRRVPNHFETIYGMTLCLAGMAIFNIGLVYGLGELGNEVGAAMPAAFQATEGIERSPLYRSGVGHALTVGFAFFLGVGATLAEPALRALGLAVENATSGTLERRTVINTVSIGVGFGVAVGVAKIVWNWPIAPLLVAGYAVLLILSLFSSEKYVSVAWDSAGVTTGPVTVPMVIALGVGLSRATGVAEGFGILALSSLFPIGAVLMAGLMAEWRITRERRRLRQTTPVDTAVDEIVA